MKKFDNLRMVLFDSTNASFRLAVEAQFTRSNQQGGYRDLVYVTDRFTGLLNPNIYLTLSYKDPKSSPNPVYTSYPQLFRLREAFETVKGYVANNEGFATDKSGAIIVKPEYAEPIVLANIGKSNNWISLKLCVVQSGEEGVVTYTPGVTIELSTSNGYASALTTEEFLTLYSIVKDLDLASLQCMMSLAYLQTDGTVAAMPMMAAPAPSMYYGAAPAQQYPQQPAPTSYYGGQGGYQQPRGQSTPRYGGNGYRSAPRAPQAPVQAPIPQQQPDQPTMMHVNNPVPPAPTKSQPAPRPATKPTITLGAVNDTPINEVSYDDSEAIDAIFDEDND